MKLWKRMKAKEKIAMLLMALGSSCTGIIPVEAANLVLTIPSDYSTSQMGAVTGSRVTTHVDAKPIEGIVQNLNRDPGLYGGFTINGKSMLVLRQYTYSTTILKPTMVIDPNGNTAEPVASGIVKNAANPHGGASDGKYIYLTDYDLGGVSVSRIDGKRIVEESSMTITKEKFFQDLQKGFEEGTAPFSYDPKTINLHTEGALVDKGHLLVACNINPYATGWMEYKDCVLFNYQITDNGLIFKGAARIPRNCDSVKINKYNDHYILNGIGGPQMWPGNETAIGIVSMQVSKGVTHPKEASHYAVLPKGVEGEIKKYDTNFYDSKVTPDGQAYLLAYEIKQGMNHYTVYKTTISNLCSENPTEWERIIGTRDIGYGFFGRINYDYYTKRLWAEISSTLEVYTDGDINPKYSWESVDFSTNKKHSQFNSVAMVMGDKVVGTPAMLRSKGLFNIDAYKNPVVEKAISKKSYDAAMTGTKKDAIYQDITKDWSHYLASKDIYIKRNIGVGDLETNVYAGVLARNGNDIIVDAHGHRIDMQLSNDIGSPTGIYTGNGKNVTMKADSINIATIVDADSGNSLSHAIWNDAGKYKGGIIDITGHVNVFMGGGIGGYGVAVHKLDRWGEKSNEAFESSKIHIHGDLSIRGKEGDQWGIPVNFENVFSRFNSAGILTTVDKSEIYVDGMVDLAVYGNGITTMAEDSQVTIGGGRIEVPLGMKYGYYSLGAYAGAIHVNTGIDGKTIGNKTVQLAGDVFVMKPATVNIALTNNKSYLQGIIDSGGISNLTIEKGAIWYNKRQNSRYEKDDEDIGFGEKSHVTKLMGASSFMDTGMIYQKDKMPITVDNYSGHVVVFYNHEENDPKHIIGGNVIIGKAEEGSEIILRTDRKGLSMDSQKEEDKKLVDDTLSYLASKLFYIDYKFEGRNLNGYVEIMEGITEPGVSRRIEHITYKKNGQGKYLDIPEEAIEPGEGSGSQPEEDPNLKGRTPETLMMNVGKNSMALAAIVWLSDMSHLQQRMGDIRLEKAESGLWARYTGGRNQWKPNITEAIQTYNIGQVGYDTYVGEWIIGGAFNYGTTNDTYYAYDVKKMSTAGGEGKENQYGLAIYASKAFHGGQYIDFIAKSIRVHNRYILNDALGKTLSADYDTQGYSISGEYGRTIQMGHGFYVKPDVQLMMGYMEAADYTADSTFDDEDEVDIHQDAIYITRGTFGLEIGHVSEEQNIFLKVSACKNFKGDLQSYFSRENKPKPRRTSLSIKDNWVEIEMGGSRSIGENMYIYGNISKSFGAVIKKDWKFDVGMRLGF